jgi:hypothetical protein
MMTVDIRNNKIKAESLVINSVGQRPTYGNRGTNKNVKK